MILIQNIVLDPFIQILSRYLRVNTVALISGAWRKTNHLNIL